jgi:hypothetical protein
LFVVLLYLQLSKVYHEGPRYFPLVKGSHHDGDSHGSFSIGDDHQDDVDSLDLEAAKS